MRCALALLVVASRAVSKIEAWRTYNLEFADSRQPQNPIPSNAAASVPDHSGLVQLTRASQHRFSPLAPRAHLVGAALPAEERRKSR